MLWDLSPHTVFSEAHVIVVTDSGLTMFNLVCILMQLRISIVVAEGATGTDVMRFPSTSLT